MKIKKVKISTAILIFFTMLPIMSCTNKNNERVHEAELIDNPKIYDYHYLISSKLADYYHITYFSDGLKINGYLGIPKMDGKLPVIVYNRGGNKNFDMLDGREIISYTELGYITIASQYRGGGYSEGVDEFGGDDVNDVINVIKIAQSFGITDKERIGMIGVSRGGLMTYMALLRSEYSETNSGIKCAVIKSGVSDLISLINENHKHQREMYNRVMIPLIGGDYEEIPEEYLRRSIRNYQRKIDTQFLIVHGDNDTKVPVSQAIIAKEKLEENGCNVEMYRYKDSGHFLSDTSSMKEILLWMGDKLSLKTDLSIFDWNKNKEYYSKFYEQLYKIAKENSYELAKEYNRKK